MTHTDKLTTVALYHKNALVAKQVALGIADIWFGDQEKIARTPTVCVEPVTKRRIISGVAKPGGMVTNTFEVHFLIYHIKLQDVQVTRQEVDTLAEAIEVELHKDVHLGTPPNDLIIHGFVEEMESGYVYRAGTLYRSVRMIWRGQSKTHLTPV